MKKFPSFLTFTLILIALWYVFYSRMPQRITTMETSKGEFSTLRALTHVKAIAQKPHYLGSRGHESVKQYIMTALKNLGLQPELQEGFIMQETEGLGKPQNIIARIPGSTSGKALLLLAHYDSAAHSAIGASDDASGVATILEGIRAFLHRKTIPKNDIVICFTDGEELGHLGAELFIQKHRYAQDIGIALNFEARGSGGPAIMLLETPGNNKNLIDAFIKAKVPYPVSNSLAYSIYKMLPNNTDLTVLKTHSEIEGYNFAFIDDFYDYHSANDTWERLDLNTLQHQGSYLMALLHYFTSAKLPLARSQQDYVYFSAPMVTFVNYPFDWIYSLLAIAILFFLGVLLYGKIKKRIQFRILGTSLVKLTIALCLATLITIGGWKVLQYCYVEYAEMQQGFPYNGHYYVVAFVGLSLGICFRLFTKIQIPNHLPSVFASAVSIWLLIATITAFFLKGASYIIIPVLFGITTLLLLIRQQRPHPVALVFLVFPALAIIPLFIESFPIALGFKAIGIVAILTVLLFGLLLPIFGWYRRKKLVSYGCFGLTFLCLSIAHFKASFTAERPKPNSLLYVLDTDENTAHWATYDYTLDSWTKNYLDTQQRLSSFTDTYPLQSKYNINFTHTHEASIKNIPQPITSVSQDTILGNRRHFTLTVTPQRDVHRMELYFEKIAFTDTILANGQTFAIAKPTIKTVQNNRLTYYVRDREPLVLQMNVKADTTPKITLLESSVDVLDNPLFSVPKREPYMMPKPFVMNDAIVLKKTIIPKYSHRPKKVDTLTHSHPIKDSLL